MTLQEVISLFSGKRILVVGDLMLDHYTMGDVWRISVEAPVPVVRRVKEEFRLGGAANVAHNIITLGAHAVLAGTVSNDWAGEKLLALLKDNGLATDFISGHTGKPTTVKHRVISGNHQLLRIDTEEYHSLPSNDEDVFLSRLEPEIRKADAVILSDYAKGLFTKRSAEHILKKARECQKMILADPKPSSRNFFVGVDAITPNISEGREMVGAEAVDEIGQALVKDFEAHVVLTRGGEGISVFSTDGRIKHIPARRPDFVDVTGAGDTVLAVLSLGFAVGLTLEQAAELANTAGGIVVQKKGTAPIFPEELLSESLKI